MGPIVTLHLHLGLRDKTSKLPQLRVFDHFRSRPTSFTAGRGSGWQSRRLTRPSSGIVPKKALWKITNVLHRRFSSQKPYYTNASDVPRSLQSWVSTIQTVVLTADVFHLLIKCITSDCEYQTWTAPKRQGILSTCLKRPPYTVHERT